MNLPLNLNNSDVPILILDENNCNLWIKLAFVSERLLLGFLKVVQKIV